MTAIQRPPNKILYQITTQHITCPAIGGPRRPQQQPPQPSPLPPSPSPSASPPRAAPTRVPTLGAGSPGTRTSLGTAQDRLARWLFTGRHTRSGPPRCQMGASNKPRTSSTPIYRTQHPNPALRQPLPV
jgi:hypothetical protein